MPYGVLVESMSFCEGPEHEARRKESGSDETQEQMHRRAKRDLTTTKPDDDNEVWRNMLFVMFADPEKKKAIQRYNPADVTCAIFGHTCPVFAHGYLNVTETRETRRITRSIRYDIMFKVARRDDFRCQKCHTLVIRLLCGTCNRKKGSSLEEILNPEP